MEDTASNIITELIGLGMLQENYFFESKVQVPEFYGKSCVIEVEEHDFVAKVATSPIHALSYNDEKDILPNFKTLLIRSLFDRSFRAFSQVHLQTVCALQFMLVLDLFGNIDYLPDEMGNLVHLSELSTLTYLRNLDVRNVSEDHASELYAAIFKLENLVSLSLNAENTYPGTPLPELEFFSPPPHLQELCLRGGLFEIPNWLASVENLTILELSGSNLLENPSSILQFLPKLKHLILDEAYKAKIIGKEFCEIGDIRSWKDCQLSQGI
ncbi:hypothetical protein GH714_028238 [Hevea brasiliensis]|uniref:Disease resistance R13L4/SHOC-2-like LRR domain-containing protein n=1 Tax=Hevea brasiliensis TaxID=3981 RepID=A0A6A6N5F9_HEVBR|nr:hypothetical protein GH714_028238 [Hevea brasiliensis]